MAVLSFSVLFDRLKRTLRTPACSFCQGSLENPVEQPLCPACVKQNLMRSPYPVIAGVSYPIYSACGFPYALKKRLYGLKFYRNLFQVAPLSDAVIHYLETVPELKNKRFVMVPVPHRRYNPLHHVAEIMRPVASHFSWTFKDHALVWTRETTSQHNVLSRRKRFDNIKGALVANPKLAHDLEHAEAILVVDDILTTGATMNEAIKAIAQSVPHVPVFGLTLCHVPFAIGHHHS